MGTNLRRVYIYPPLEHDGIAANPFRPPGKTGPSQLSDDQLPPASSDSSGSYVDQGGGLLGMLLRGMQQDRDQLNVNSSSGSNGASEADSGNNGSPQGGLLGKLAALQAQQNPSQPLISNNALAPSDPRNPNFRQLSRIAIPIGLKRETGYDQPASYLSQSNGAPLRASVSNTDPSVVRWVSRDSNLSPAFQNSPALVNGRAVVVGVDSWNPEQMIPRTSGGVLDGYSDQRMPPSSATAPTIKTAQLALPGIGIPLPPMPPGRLPQIPMPAIPDWWKAAGPILRGVFSHLRVGGYDDYSRCMKAAAGSDEQWGQFCDSLGQGQNKVVGGQSQKKACWSKTYESETNKKLWCANQFGKFD